MIIYSKQYFRQNCKMRKKNQRDQGDILFLWTEDPDSFFFRIQVTQKDGSDRILYDTVQERTIQEQKEVSPARLVQEKEPPRPAVDEVQERSDPEEEREFINNIMEDNILDLDVDYEDYRILYESE